MKVIACQENSNREVMCEMWFNSMLEFEAFLKETNDSNWCYTVKKDREDEDMVDIFLSLDSLINANQCIRMPMSLRCGSLSVADSVSVFLSKFPDMNLAGAVFGLGRMILEYKNQSVILRYDCVEKSVVLVSCDKDENVPPDYVTVGDEIFPRKHTHLDGGFIWLISDELVCYPWFGDKKEFVNLLTEEMDSYLLDSIKGLKNEFLKTYIYLKDELKLGEKQHFAFRYPGATRGSIYIDENNEITKIDLYDDEYHTDSIYKPDVRSIFDKYIGLKLVKLS